MTNCKELCDVKFKDGSIKEEILVEGPFETSGCVKYYVIDGNKYFSDSFEILGLIKDSHELYVEDLEDQIKELKGQLECNKVNHDLQLEIERTNKNIYLNRWRTQVNWNIVMVISNAVSIAMSVYWYFY